MDEVTDLADGQLFHERSPDTAAAFPYSLITILSDGALCIPPGGGEWIK